MIFRVPVVRAYFSWYMSDKRTVSGLWSRVPGSEARLCRTWRVAPGQLPRLPLLRFSQPRHGGNSTTLLLKLL